MALDVGQLKWEAVLNDTEFRRKINNIESQVSGISKSLEKQGSSIESMFKRASMAAAGFFSTQAATNFINSIVKVRGEFEQLEIAFSTILGSKERADRLMKDIVEFAGTTPFGLQETSNAAKQLLAYGSAANNVISELRMLGDVAAGVSQPISDLIYLYGTLRTQGKAYMMDIRQFAGRGIPIYRELAKVLGVAESEVNNLVTAGKVGFKEVELAFKNMTAAGSTFGGLMEAQSQSIAGELERLKDAWDVMLNEIGQSQQGLINSTIAGLSSLVENYDKVIDIIKTLIVVYGAYRAALIITTLTTSGATAAETLHYGALVIKSRMVTLLTGKMAGLTAMTSAYTLAITAVVGAVYAWNQASDEAALKQDKLNEAIEAGQKETLKERSELLQLQDVVKSQTATKEQQKAAYDKLIASTGDYLKGYAQEDIALGKAEESLDRYIKKIQETASARKALSEFTDIQDQLDNISKNGIETLSVAKRVGTGMRAAFSEGALEIWLGKRSMADAIVERETKNLTSAADTLKKEYGKLWEEIVTAGGDDSVDPSQTTTITEVTKEALSVLKELSKVEFEVHKMGLSQNEQEIASIKEKYRILREEAKKAGLGEGVIARINNAQTAELGYNAYEKDTDRFFENLEKKRNAYQAYEELRLSTSKETADRIYGHELDSYENFLDLIRDEENKLREKAEGPGLSGPEMDTLIKIEKLRKDAEKQAKEQQVRSLTESLKLVETYEKKKADIEKKYRDAALQIGTGITAEQTALLEKGLKAETDVLNNALIEELDSYKYFFDNIANLSGSRLNDAAVALEQDLADLIEKHPELKSIADIISKRIAGAKTAQTAEDFRSMAESFSFIADALQEVDTTFAALVRTASNLAGQVSNIKNDIEAFSVATQNGNTLGQISSGLGIIGAGFNIMNSINNFLDRTTKADEQRLRNSELQLEATEGMTKALERQIKLANEAYGTQKIEEYRKAIEQANKTIDESGTALAGRYVFTGDAEIDKLIDKVNRGERLKKFKLWGDSEREVWRGVSGGLTQVTTDVEKLQWLLDNGKLDTQTAQIAQNFINAHDAIKEAEMAMIAFNTAIEFDTLSDNLIDAISSGNDAIKELGDNFEETMKNAILNSLKDGQFKKELEAWYNAFNDAMDGGLTDTEVESLRQDYLEIGERQRDRLLAMEKATGLDLNGSDTAFSKKGLRGAIAASCTEESMQKTETRIANITLI